MRQSTDPRIVVALGGNALGNTPTEQLRNIKKAVPSIIDLISKGFEIIITHGNGPQVGMIKNAFADGSKFGGTDMPLAECTAMSQGYIGFHLQKELREELRKREMPWHVATVVTQIVVDPEDAAFSRPTKPIGPFFSEKEASRRTKENPNLIFTEDSACGWRQIVPSPKPQRILEIGSIRHLLDYEFVVIACGGGGIPVISLGDEHYEAVDAVIDKDFSAAKLAEEVHAKYLIILTSVEHASLCFGTEKEEPLADLSVEEAETYLRQGQFGVGSMKPKIEAGIEFAAGGRGRIAIITSLEKAACALDGSAGTRIALNPESFDRYFVPSEDSHEKTWLFREEPLFANHNKTPQSFGMRK